MVEMKDLLTVSVVVDSDVEYPNIGEIEYGIYEGLIMDHIENYGHKGKKDIIDNLAFLIGVVHNMEVPVKPEDIACYPMVG